jgi:RNA polymerase sigma-54 factor
MQPGMSLNLGQRQELQLRLAPKMIQSMEILQLPIMALQKRIAQEMQENPVIEELPQDLADADEESEARVDEPEFNVDAPLVIDEYNDDVEFKRLEALNKDWDDHFNEEHRPSRNLADEQSERKHDAMQNMPSPPPSLHDHLVEQLPYLEVEPEQYELLRYVISHIDDNGYLVEHLKDRKNETAKEREVDVARPLSLEDLVANYSKPVTLVEMEATLEMIQRLDPPGVGARDLKECLLLQLKPGQPHYELLRKLILDHLDDIWHNRLPVIQKKTGASLEQISAAIETLRELNPKPGGKFTSESTQYVVPDIIVERTDSGEYEVRLADDWEPRIHIPRRFYEMYKEKGQDPTVKEFLRRKLQSAEWLTDAIRQRRQTLQKVTRAIIQHQRAFLDNGPEFIEPLKMQQIADQVGVHVTTISRAVDDKWVQTPRGVFPLKRFFGGGTRNEVTGEEVAWETIKNKLLEMIGSEDKSNPLSDEELVEMMHKSGYPVARRTVTKYRKMLDIPSSRQRKDWTK